VTRTHKPLKVFCSYSHEDEHYLEVLKTWLVGLERDGLIEQWHDRMISAGGEWEEAIAEHLQTSAMVLLLITPDFMASQYIYEKELSRAVEKHRRGEARVIPIIVRPSPPLKGTPFGKLQALPKDGKPITTWPNQDEAWLDILTGIQQAVAEFSFSRQAPGQEGSSEQIYRDAVEWAWMDGKLHSREAVRLRDLANEYELSTDSASAIEREVMGDSKEAILDRQERAAREKERKERLEGLYTRARGLHQDQEWQAVVDVFKEIHAEDPNHPDPERLLASARKALGVIDKEQNSLRQYHEAVELVWADRELDRPEVEKLKVLADELKLSPSNAANIEREVMGDTKEAILKSASDALQLNRLDEFYAQARGAHQAQEWQRVVSIFDQIREVDPAYTDPEELLLSAREALASQAVPLPDEKEILPQQLNFEEADRRFAELWQSYYAGALSAEQYDAQVRQLMLQDAEGRWWAKVPETGVWNYYDGAAWIPGTPPTASLQKAESSGSTPSVDSLTQICTKYAGPAYNVSDAIPKEQVTNARLTFPIPDNDKVIALLDTTRRGSNTRGLAICESGIGWYNNQAMTRSWTALPRQFLPWREFRNASIKTRRKGPFVTPIEMGAGNVFFLRNSSMDGNDLVRLLLELQSLLRTMPSSPSNTGV
jgi:chorismate mutase